MVPFAYLAHPRTLTDSGDRETGRPKKTVTIKLFAFFRENRFREQEQEVDARATVRDLIVAQGIDPGEVGVTMINSRHCTLDQVPAQGDQVAIFPVIGGG